ncbi:hypothetical protein [Haloechinothrix halophila]|uniref:hypothetical protein n=1 Tax=Haloechinothrix halophila TaxID=1069073 RepID=UPI00042027AC|nr:hypothetical protein [Haloechinothrix halophila]
MSKLRRNVAAGAATVLVASSAMLALPGSAVAADPIVAGSCGQTLQGDAGAPLSINLASALGISGAPTVGLGTVTEGTKTYSLTKSELLDALGGLSLLGVALPSVCGVTVTGVKTVTESVEKVTEPVTDAVKDGAETLEKATEPVTDAVEGLVGSGGSDNEPASGGGGNDGSPNNGPSGAEKPRERQQPVPGPSSPPIEPSNSGFGAPYYSSFSPMGAFSSFPYRNASFSTHAPGLRYGSGFGDYAPSFGVLGQDGSSNGDAVANAGSADALPPAQGRVGLPMLLAVLALAAASAGLVRSWVLRSIARVR